MINSFPTLKSSSERIKAVILVLALACFMAGWTVAATSSGKQLYIRHCSNCHGIEGEGFLKLYPPINNTRFLKQDLAILPCIIRDGLRGKIIVEEQQFNQAMPGNKKLSTADMAQVIVYMQRTWTTEESDLRITEWLSNCSPQ